MFNYTSIAPAVHCPCRKELIVRGARSQLDAVTGVLRLALDEGSGDVTAETTPYLIVDATREPPGSVDEEQVSAWQSGGVPVIATSWRRAGALNTALFLAGDQEAQVSAGGKPGLMTELAIISLKVKLSLL